MTYREPFDDDYDYWPAPRRLSLRSVLGMLGAALGVVLLAAVLVVVFAVAMTLAPF